MREGGVRNPAMVLTGDQVARLTRLLDQALPLDSDGRKRWLEDLSPEYEALMPALRQALLSGDARSSAALLATLPTVESAPNAVTVMSSELRAGQRIGPYRLQRELGAGGMGAVWLAQRADGAFRREVALKLPLMSRLRPDLAERFARECDILAGLEHANIARMYDAGVSSDGLPYLALEYVEGKPLTAWCDEHQASVRDRLRLFLQVLDAVHYAHGRQVVHRDLKPSNLLVTPWGQVRLLDFGVAKMLDDGANAFRTDLTQAYGRLLTPDYASPEQLLGQPVSVRSDIYTLGIVLYELLVGSRPHPPGSGPPPAALEPATGDSPVSKPSTRVQAPAALARATTRGKLVRRLRGDLDSIVLKALAREPADRYDSARSFADDVRRYLNGGPVEARSSSRLGSRVLRALERHPFATAAAATLLAAAVQLAIQNQEAWVPTLQTALDGLAARSAAVLERLRADEPAPRPR
jgi:serine/threonine protein kinase